MIDKIKHKTILIKILKEFYADSVLRKNLGFKGGTAVFLFYNLPRFSVDLDFDLLNELQKQEVFKRCQKILPRFGKLQDAREKRFTLFFLLSYGLGKRKVKIEISKRPTASCYKTQQYLGISMLVMCQEDMAAGKLAALLTRRRFAARDLFDLWFFLKNDWEINSKVVKEKTDLDLVEALVKARKRVEKVKKNQLLQGVGDLLDESRKSWVRENLKKELLFYLDLYLKQ